MKKFNKDFNINFNFIKMNFNIINENFRMNSIQKKENSRINSNFKYDFIINFKNENIKFNQLFQKYKYIFQEDLSKELLSKYIIDYIIDINNYNLINKNIYSLLI